MPRQPRNQLGDGVYHVTNRGVARMTLFHDPGDFRHFGALLERVTGRWSWALHAWCLMPNHFHLVLAAGLGQLSEGMHRLNMLYAQAFNARYGRVGHVFQNRFGARLVESDDHLEAACEYVLANPVRAELCDRPEDWPWSGPRRPLGASGHGAALSVNRRERRRPRAQR